MDTAGNRRRLGWLLKLAAGLLVFWLAFRDVDPSATGRAFALVDPAWLTAAAVSVFLTVSLIVMRWRVLLGAAVEARHAPVLFAAVIASQVANIVMPFKLGDAVRIGAVSRALAVPPAEVLGSVAVERLFDAAILAMTAALLAAIGILPSFAQTGMSSLALVVGAAVLAAGAVVRFRAALGRSAGRLTSAAPARVRAWLGRQADLLRGLNRVSKPAVAATALFWSAAVMAGSVLTAWLVLRAFDLDAPATSAAIVVIAVQIGGAVVPIPGAVGISQVLTVQVLALWGVPEAPALAYALMLYLVSRVPKLALLPFVMSALHAGKSEPGLKSRPTE